MRDGLDSLGTADEGEVTAFLLNVQEDAKLGLVDARVLGDWGNGGRFPWAVRVVVDFQEMIAVGMHDQDDLSLDP